MLDIQVFNADHRNYCIKCNYDYPHATTVQTIHRVTKWEVCGEKILQDERDGGRNQDALLRGSGHLTLGNLNYLCLKTVFYVSSGQKCNDQSRCTFWEWTYKRNLGYTTEENVCRLKSGNQKKGNQHYNHHNGNPGVVTGEKGCPESSKSLRNCHGSWLIMINA